MKKDQTTPTKVSNFYRITKSQRELLKQLLVSNIQETNRSMKLSGMDAPTNKRAFINLRMQMHTAFQVLKALNIQIPREQIHQHRRYNFSEKFEKAFLKKVKLFINP